MDCAHRTAVGRDPGVITAARFRVRREAAWAATACVLSAPLLLPTLGVALPGWILVALATPVQLVVGARFYAGAWRALRAFTADQDVLIVLGTSAAYAFSLYRLAAGPQGADLYFDASAVVIAVTVVGKWLEARAESAHGVSARAHSAPALADRVAAWFVPCVLILALVSLGGWSLIVGDLAAGITAAASVLVIACPCALGLPTPAALAAGIGAADRAGMLIRDAESREAPPPAEGGPAARKAVEQGPNGAQMPADPRWIADRVALRRAIAANIRQGLFWAFLYNVIALPAAALGMLSPAVAAAAMGLSCVSVVLNALRLTGWKPAAHAAAPVSGDVPPARAHGRVPALRR